MSREFKKIIIKINNVQTRYGDIGDVDTGMPNQVDW